MSALGTHEKKQAGDCTIHLFCLGDREAVYDFFGHTRGNHKSLVMQGLKPTVVSRLLSSTQMPNSHRKSQSSTGAGGNEYTDDGEAASVLRGVSDGFNVLRMFSIFTSSN